MLPTQQKLSSHRKVTSYFLVLCPVFCRGYNFSSLFHWYLKLSLFECFETNLPKQTVLFFYLRHAASLSHFHSTPKFSCPHSRAVIVIPTSYEPHIYMIMTILWNQGPHTSTLSCMRVFPMLLQWSFPPFRSNSSTGA